jgi:predicted phage terminase large subunit-like protein
MANGIITIQDVEQYVDVVIPNIESELANPDLSAKDKLELYNLYVDVLRLVAPHNFHCYNKYLELDEDHTSPTRAFYHHRKNHIGEIFDAMNDMEIYDKYDMLLISLAPRIGKSTAGIRFLSWIIGRHPENTQLAISYSDSITTSFYIGTMEIVQSQRFKEIFADAPLVSQNAKREEIWLKVAKRYPSISFVPIGGSMTGRAEAGNYLYCDDLVSGIEEAMSLSRMEKLWQLYTVNCKQRKKDGCKEIHVATRWSVHDPITKLAKQNADNPRCKIISVPCFNEKGESNFDFVGGFSTAYYKELQKTMDEASFKALYECEPIEREGLLYHKEDLQYYYELPSGKPDTIVAICDSKNLGKDYVTSLVAYIYGDYAYIEDVVFNNGLPDVTRPLVANMWLRNNVVRGDVELNNGGNYYAEDLDELIKKGGGKTSIRIFYSANNKNTKIITYSDYAKKHLIFKASSKYSPNSEYAKFMQALLSWTQKGNNAHDDAPDATAMLSQLLQELQGTTIKILNRRELGL